MRNIKYKLHERKNAMNNFKTYVITKRTLYKALVLVLIAISFVIIIGKVLISKSVPAFSYNATKIIQKGTTKDNFKETAINIAEEMIGFDVTNPKDIMDKSSSVLENAPTPSPSVTTTIAPENFPSAISNSYVANTFSSYSF